MTGLAEQRRRVSVGLTAPANAEGTYDSGAYDAIGVDNALDLDKFRAGFKANVVKRDADELVLDLVGVDAPIANSLRRVLLSDVATMAIETVYFYDNSSIIHDEILAHRLGLVPILADPSLFEDMVEGKEESDTHVIKFRLEVACKAIKDAPAEARPEAKYTDSSVYSSSLEWMPVGSQAERFKDRPIRPVHGDILLAKLRPGQRIHLEMTCVKGTGATHAKWSPVATAFYRMLPEITFQQSIIGSKAKEIADKCPMKVFDIEDDELVASRPRDCTMCRECLRTPDGEDDSVTLSRLRDHFIFSIESTGSMPPEQIFREGLRVMQRKCEVLIQGVEDCQDEEQANAL